MPDRQIVAWIYQNTRSQIPRMVILIVSNAAFAVCGVGFALLSRSVIDGAIAGDRQTLLQYILLLLGVVLLQLFLRLLSRNLEEVIKARLEMSYKSLLFGRLLYKDYPVISTYHSGSLLNHLTSDITIISEGVTTIVPTMVSLLTRLLCAFAVLVAIDHSFALIFAAGGILLFVVIGAFRGLMKRMHKKVLEADGKLRSFMQEALETLLVIKAFGVQGRVSEHAVSLQQSHYRARMKRMKTSILANTGFSFIFQIGYLYALAWSAYKLYMHVISFGTLTAVLQLVGQVQTPFIGLSGLLPQYYGVLASVERIMELEKLQDETEVNSAGVNYAEVASGMESLVFEHVSFSYDRECILEDVSLCIDKGDFAALSGASGIGKTTVLKLLLGVYKPNMGEVYLQMNDGNRTYIDQHTRRLFAYVPQGNFLLSGSIRDNIAFIKPEAKDSEIMEAARIACADEFIEELPAGLDTVIGEKGCGLSEGQVQRLAIARAVLCDAPILLLDEASSALDEPTEKRLLENLRSMKDKTCLIISHRPTALNICDKELRIEDKSHLYWGEPKR
ncbi:MAG: ABC transporter ATP-binding protein [Chitinophagales bacterium]